MEKIEFEEVLSTQRGHDLISDIGAALVQKQLKMRSSVDSLCQILLQRCPSFFGESEVVVYQGSECLERAGITRDPIDRDARLQDSLKLFLRGSPALSLPIVTEISRKYHMLAFFPGIVELCLAVASLCDPENISLVSAKNPNLQLDTKQQEIVSMRDGIYSLVFQALKAVHGVDAGIVSSIVGNLGKAR